MLPDTTSTFQLATLPGKSWGSVPIMAEPISSNPGQTRPDTVTKDPHVKRVGVTPRTRRVSLSETVSAKAVGVDCGARLLKHNLVANPVVNPIYNGRYFEESVFLNALTFAVAGDNDRNAIRSRVATPIPERCGEMTTNLIHHLNVVQSAPRRMSINRGDLIVMTIRFQAPDQDESDSRGTPPEVYWVDSPRSGLSNI